MKQDVSLSEEPAVVVRGDVPEHLVAYAREKLQAVIRHAPQNVLSASLRLDHHTDPARPRPDHVEMTVDLERITTRARESAETMTEAIDRAASRLRRRMEAAADRPAARQKRHRDSRSWHHDDEPTLRPSFYPRPVEERAVVRRKTFAIEPESIEDALFDLELLDHDFLLFVHDETDAEAVAYRVGSDGYGLLQRTATPDAVQQVGIPIETGAPPVTTTLDDAVAMLNETDAPFEFFVDEETGRAAVVYRRYDGHYGLILPA